MSWDRSIDVVAVGVTAVDEVIVVDRFPREDDKVEVLERRTVCGGLAATALVAAARLGASAEYAGSMGRGADSLFVLKSLENEGVGIEAVHLDDSTSPIHSTVVVSKATGARTIFFDHSGYRGPTSTATDIIRLARALLVDNLGLENTIVAARVARSLRVPVVADIEGDVEDRRIAELLSLVDHLVLSESTACALTRTTSAEDALFTLGRQPFEAVVVTCGDKGCRYAGAGESVQTLPAFPIVAQDTTGCGDIFHGAYATGLARGLALPDRIRFSAAAAALAAADGRGGQAAAPTAAAVQRFLSLPSVAASASCNPTNYSL